MVVWHLDRLHRQPKELEEFFEVCDAAGRVAPGSCHGDVDLATHDGRFTGPYPWARWRRRRATTRAAGSGASTRRSRSAGRVAGGGDSTRTGSRPTGGRSARVGGCGDPRVRARSSRGGVDALDLRRPERARRPRLSTGREWQPQTFRRMLLSARISGQREHRGEIVAEAEWPAIITPAETDADSALCADPERRTNKTARRYLLDPPAALRPLRATLVVAARERRNAPLRVRERPRLLGLREDLGRGRSARGVRRRGRALPARLARARRGAERRARRPRRRAVAGRGRASTGAARRARHDYGERRSALRSGSQHAHRSSSASRSRRSASPAQPHLCSWRPVGNATDCGSSWPKLPLTRQHAIVAAVLDHLVVAPGRRGYNRFDPSRFEPVWRA